MKPYGEQPWDYRLNHRRDPSLPDNDGRRYDPWKWESAFDDCYSRQKAKKARRDARLEKRAQRGHARQQAKQEIERQLQEMHHGVLG